MSITESDGVPERAHSVPWRRVRLTIVGVDRVHPTGTSTAASGPAQLPEAAPVAEISRYAVPY